MGNKWAQTPACGSEGIRSSKVSRGGHCLYGRQQYSLSLDLKPFPPVVCLVPVVKIKQYFGFGKFGHCVSL